MTTTSGDVTLNVPRLKGATFETAIIERYRRRESSVEEALIEMYLAGVSVRRVEDITEALWGSKVSPSTISELNKKAYAGVVLLPDFQHHRPVGLRCFLVYPVPGTAAFELRLVMGYLLLDGADGGVVRNILLQLEMQV